MKSSSTGESNAASSSKTPTRPGRGLGSRVVSLFNSFFKKHQQEKLNRGPHAGGDNESVVDVDDDEFEKVLGEWSHGGAAPPPAPHDLSADAALVTQIHTKETRTSWTWQATTWTSQGESFVLTGGEFCLFGPVGVGGGL